MAWTFYDTCQWLEILTRAILCSITSRTFCSVHEQLHAKTTHHVIPLRVDNVFGPSPAPDLDDHPRLDIPELKPDKRGDIVVLVVVRVIIARKALPWFVVHLPKPFLVRLCVALAGQPDHSQLRTPVCLVPLTAMFLPSCLDLPFQLVWHLWMLLHLCDVVKRLRFPPKHLVQLHNQAWLPVEISKELCLRAWGVVRKVYRFLSRNSTPLIWLKGRCVVVALL